MGKAEADAGVGDGTVAMLAFAAQVGALLAGRLVVTFGSADPYGRSQNYTLGLAGLFMLGLPLLLVLGVLHTIAISMPASLGAEAVAKRLRGAEWQWRGVFLVLLGALYAGLLVPAGAPYAYGWAAISLSGVLPLLAVSWFRRRQECSGRVFTTGAVWFWSLAAGFLFAAAVAAACAVAVGTGLVGS